MNRRGQVIFVNIMLAALVFIMLVSLMEPMKDQARSARVNLNCSAEDSTFGEASTCIVTDSYVFAFFGAGLAAALAFIGARKIGVL